MITIYGALSDAEGDGKTTEIALSYWPEDLLSEYGLDLHFFVANAKKHSSRMRVKPSSEGAVWEEI